MALHLIDVDENNWREIASLSVSESQKDYIETNAFSILESFFNPDWNSVGLYDEEILVGYAMYGCFEKSQIWLDRFMIDQKYQSKKYGERFLQLIIAQLIKRYPITKILLSFVPHNYPAKRFYEKWGFIDTGSVDELGEIIYQYNV